MLKYILYSTEISNYFQMPGLRVAGGTLLLNTLLNPLSPNSDPSSISPCNIKGLSVREIMRIENRITQVKFS